MFNERGQASIEYALVMFAFMALVAALGAMWHFASDGQLGFLTDEHTSHALVQPGGVVDALMF